MSATLNRIFDDILNAERQAHCKKQHLANIKEEIMNLKLKERELQGETLLMQAEIAMKQYLEENISLDREKFCWEAKLFCKTSKFIEKQKDSIMSNEQKEILKNLEEVKDNIIAKFNDYKIRRSELTESMKKENYKINDLELEKDRVATWPPTEKSSKLKG